MLILVMQSDDSEDSPFSYNVSIHLENDSVLMRKRPMMMATWWNPLKMRVIGIMMIRVTQLQLRWKRKTVVIAKYSIHIAISMENHDHSVSGDTGANALVKESAVDVSLCEDNRNEQDIGVDVLVKESAVDSGLCEDNHNEQACSCVNCYCITWCLTAVCLAPMIMWLWEEIDIIHIIKFSCCESCILCSCSATCLS
ncbi:hypothetical protein RchiOBHm_Chr3g0495101 [Rosa chinensis]|uniref:Uncharacterized protein n=1 Tax=Rosa chinensis TaxID=74649 RepID=A0A2P6RH64_ROSCH|nr:hypothetical protein RchiOBHm_Chr3g0495101 [Rosa chinensis]